MEDTYGEGDGYVGPEEHVDAWMEPGREPAVTLREYAHAVMGAEDTESGVLSDLIRLGQMMGRHAPDTDRADRIYEELLSASDDDDTFFGVDIAVARDQFRTSFVRGYMDGSHRYDAGAVGGD